MMRVVIIIFSLATFGFASCFKNCSDTTYSFDMLAKVYPDYDSIQIGDTTWVDVSAPTMAEDKISHKTVDYSDAENMVAALQIFSLHPASDTDAGSSYATTNFTYILKKGSNFSADQFAMNYLFEESGNVYNLKVGFIPKDTGTYRLYVSDAINVFRRKHKCDKASFSMSFTESNQHLYLYNIVKPNYQPDGIGAHYSYCFRVY